PIEDGRFVCKFRRQLAFPGFPRALLSMFRHHALGDQADAYEALRGCRLPMLVLRGEEDPICTAAQIERLRGWLPDASVTSLPGTGHAMMLLPRGLSRTIRSRLSSRGCLQRTASKHSAPADRPLGNTR
ncbi:MAG: alpha/beta fold hydrolase, partial [Zwartia sp.]